MNLSDKQAEVFKCIDKTWKTRRQIAEHMGLWQGGGSTSHWIEAQLKALFKKGLIERRLVNINSTSIKPKCAEYKRAKEGELTCFVIKPSTKGLINRLKSGYCVASRTIGQDM